MEKAETPMETYENLPQDEAVIEAQVAILPAIAVNTYPGGSPMGTVNGLVNKNAISPLIQLTEAIGNREELIFRSTRRIGFDATAASIQIYGTDEFSSQFIMSTMMDPGVTIRHNSVNPKNAHTFRTGVITKFQNEEGITLMTCRETGRAQNVSSGDRVFGLVDGVGLYSTQLKARDSKGDTLFQTVERNGVFSFISNDVEIAKAGRGVTKKPEAFGVKFSQPGDMTMKAMLFATAYYLYYLHVADTIFGLRGSKGVALARCWLVLAAVFGLLTIFVAVVAIIIHS